MRRVNAGHVGLLAFLLLTAGASLLPSSASALERGHRLWMDGRKVTLSPTLELPIPSFSRQTKLPCNACHTAFPQLTPFGRLFKLNGYTLVGIEKVTAAQGAAGGGLSLDLIPPLSVMALSSVTHVGVTPPGTQNNTTEFPDQLSLFVGEAITPKLGTFLQFTYSGADGSFGWDNAEIRFATHATLDGKPTILGLTLNNSPTVQDVWNSTPVWGYPFVGSEVAPTPAAATAVEGELAQRVAGLGAYLFWNNLVYAELSAYRSAPQGGAHPANASAEATIRGVSPYWRVALSHDVASHSLEVGTFGLSSRQYGTGVEGPTDDFLDLGVDGQYQRLLGRTSLTAHASFIHERQDLNAAFAGGDAAAVRHTLRSFKVDGELVFRSGIGASLGYFDTSGDADAALFPAEDVTGSATHRPNSDGAIAELDFNPWLNARLGAQYVLYRRFNGGGSNYDGAGRDASGNDTLYLLAWLVF